MICVINPRFMSCSFYSGVNMIVNEGNKKNKSSILVCTSEKIFGMMIL